MNTTAYTPEVMKQTGQIYDKLEQLPLDKRVIMKVLADTFISGMLAQEWLAAERDSDVKVE